MTNNIFNRANLSGYAKLLSISKWIIFLKKEIIFIFLVFWIFCFLYSWSSGVDVNWDLRNYHLYSVYALFNHRLSVDVAPGQLQTWFNPVIQIPNYFITVFLDPRIGILIISFFSALNLIIIYLLSNIVINSNINIYINKFISLLLVFCAFYSPTFLSIIGTTFNDGINAFIIILILYINIKYKFSSKSLIVSGLLFGLVLSFKLTNIIFLLSFIIALIIQPNCRNLKSIFIFILSVIIGYVPFGFTWNIYLYYLFENPVFPLMNNIFHSPFYYDVSLTDTRFIPKTVLDAIQILYKHALGIKVTSEIPLRDIRFLILVIIAVCLAPLLFVKKSDNQRIFKKQPIVMIWLFFTISLFIWLKVYGIERYIVVLEQLSPLLIFTLIDKVGLIQYSKIFSMIIVSILIFVFVVPIDWGHIPVQKQHWWKTSYPNELKQQEVTYVLLEDEPLSYMAVSAPSKSIFVRIAGNLSNMENTALGQMAREKINSSKGQIRTLTKEKYKTNFDIILQKYNLKYTDKNCMELKSSFEIVYSCHLDKIE